jgi:tetratricopeptide (TPR) repeat protein
VRDPYFESIIWQIRGFDLGDDADLRAKLESRRRRGALGGEELMLLGALHVRANELEEAVACFELALGTGAEPSRNRYILTQLALDAGRYEDAQTHLREAERAAAEDHLVPPAELAHVAGSIKRGLGDAAGAILDYRRGLEIDPKGTPRWRALAELLLELGRTDEAWAALQRAQSEVPDELETLYELAATASVASRYDEAQRWLERAISGDPSLRTRALTDDRLMGLAPAPGISALVTDSPEDLDWLDALPPWIQKLRTDMELEELGFRWTGRVQSNELAKKLEVAYERGPAGTMHSKATLALAREQLAARRPVAHGPIMPTRTGSADPMLLFVDIHNPFCLYLALADVYPPFLWIDAGRTGKSLSAAIEPFFPRPRLTRVGMSRCVRGFIGYQGRFGIRSVYQRGVETADLLELERHLSTSPYLEAGSWGSAFQDDPWPDELPQQPSLLAKMDERQVLVGAQSEGSLWTSTRRTRHSRSYLTLEMHPEEIFIVEVRYEPSPHKEPIVEGFNERMGTGYPSDLPLDVLAALLGFQFDGSEDIQTRLEATSDPAEIAGLLWVLAALRYGDLDVVRTFRRYVDHPELVVRSALCNIFAAYNYESLLEEMSATEPDPETRDQIDELLDAGLPPPVMAEGVFEHDEEAE